VTHSFGVLISQDSRPPKPVLVRPLETVAPSRQHRAVAGSRGRLRAGSNRTTSRQQPVTTATPVAAMKRARQNVPLVGGRCPLSDALKCRRSVPAWAAPAGSHVEGMPPWGTHRERTANRPSRPQPAIPPASSCGVCKERESVAIERAAPLRPSQAAAVMGLTPVRVNQLARAGRLPHELSRYGWRLFRPEQVAVIGNARRARFRGGDVAGPHTGPPGIVPVSGGVMLGLVPGVATGVAGVVGT
jgi:hypothetical protein